MRVALLGTRGIPNNYGGFEQFAEYLATGLINQGFQVTVYNPHFHPFRNESFKGVEIVRIYCPESFLGGWANFIYDFLCLWHAYQKKFDIVYELGYGSSAISYILLRLIKPKKLLLITNMDGLEWKRSKWNTVIKRFTKWSEKVALNLSDIIISDNIGIQNYYHIQFGKQTFFFPYGAEVVNTFNIKCLTKYEVHPHKYHLIIARLEPENNIELMIQSYLESGVEEPLLIIGNLNNVYGKKLRGRYSEGKIRFLGGLYDKSSIDSLRHFSKLYLHGHSVGGTNPSLLEAMACSCLIVAHSNEFNKSVMGEGGLYFENKLELVNVLKRLSKPFPERVRMVESNLNNIERTYKWEKIINDYANFFRNSLN
jgi:glycosyltransferase involved in cell wall biosynthesis